MDGGTKRPLPHDEQRDDASDPAKRQETTWLAREPRTSGNGNGNGSSTTQALPARHAFSEVELRTKSPEALVGLVLHLQSSHSRQVADLEAHCAAITRQLKDLREVLASYVGSQTSALQLVAQHLALPRPVVPTTTDVPVPPLYHSISTSSQPPPSAHPSFPSRGPVPPTTPTAPVNTSPTPSSQPVRSPSLAQQYSSSRLGAPASSVNTPAPALGEPSSQQPTPTQSGRSAAGTPPPVQCSNLNTVTEIWREYRSGLDGGPAIELLDAQWGSRWRPEPKIRTWYSRRKLIYDKVKELMADGLDEATAVREVESMRRGRSMNWLMRLLQDDRRETKANWKAAAAAALEAKKTHRVGPAVATAPPGPGPGPARPAAGNGASSYR